MFGWKWFAMEYFEKQIRSDEKYNGVIVRVRLDEAELHTGKHVKREVVEHPGGVTILPIDEAGNCYMVRQFRYPFGEMILEAPAELFLGIPRRSRRDWFVSSKPFSYRRHAC